ncbi:hypothetical protein [Natronosalvus amylolyticus]|uniref:hypothetical protein n=1 Tax=Natronosalvus amylolyticus TaxID=2961994 RepID=UPI0020CA1D5A|nr:hypothetical protein [Natronosalvus amylolyticus]
MYDTNAEADEQQGPETFSKADLEIAAERIFDQLAKSEEILVDGETIHEWEGLTDQWRANTHVSETSIRLANEDGAWVRLSRATLSDGFDVLVGRPGDRAVPQRTLWSSGRVSYTLEDCQTHAVAQMIGYTRDGEFPAVKK